LRALGDRRSRPFALGGARVADALRDIGVAGGRAAHELASVDRGNADNVRHQMISK
jgi:hypothetical protein